jgi:ubiquinone/menaquinone biosynthesis C-methylase UbiE
MTNPDNTLISARRSAENATGLAQERNRLWWEQMPMTYVDWDKSDRALRGAEAYQRLPEYVLSLSPFLTAWFGAHEFGGQRVLDLGCGSGVFSTLLARKGGRVTAVDLTEAGVRMAAQTAKEQNIALEVVRADAEKLSFRDAAFDFIYSWGVLHHTGNMEASIGEVGRVLKPGGRGIMMVYHRRSIAYYGHGLFWLLAKGKIFRGYTLRTATDFYTDGYHHRYLTGGELVAMLGRHGLRTTAVHVTQYTKSILPFIPDALDVWLKARFGMCLVAEFTKPES